jgi:hypothetical protein
VEDASVEREGDGHDVGRDSARQPDPRQHPPVLLPAERPRLEAAADLSPEVADCAGISTEQLKQFCIGAIDLEPWQLHQLAVRTHNTPAILPQMKGKQVCLARHDIQHDFATADCAVECV